MFSYLEALHLHFQSICHFKVFKNSGFGIWQMCNRALRFGNPPRTVHQYYFACKERETGPTGKPPTPGLYAAWDEKFIEMSTDAAPHCGPRTGGTFFDVMSGVEKDSQDVSAGIGQLKKSDIKEFCPKFDVKVSAVNFDIARLN